MKKVFALLLAIAMLLTMAACGKAPETPVEGGDSGKVPEQTQPVKETETPTEEPTEAFEPSTWGVTDRFTAKNAQGQKSCYINLPAAAGNSAGYGRFVIHADDTAVMYSGQNDKCPEISGISELLPTYFERVEYAFSAHYGMLSSNYEFTLTGDKAVTVGEYEMHMFEGVIAFDYDGEHREYPFVAYATTLKSNGAYAYWLVYDISDNQSNGNLIAEYAYNMARTFREEK